MFFSSCQKPKAEHTIIKGEIQNGNVDTVIIKDVLNKAVDSIAIKDKKSFIDTLKLPAGYYKINIGKEYTWTYLAPGYNLDLKVDNNSFDKTVSYTGKGSKINNYLSKKMLKSIELKPKSSYLYYGKLDEKSFLKLEDSIQNVMDDLLKKSGIEDQDFINLEKKEHILKKAAVLYKFEMVKKYLTRNDDYKNSDSFPNPLQNIDINDAAMMKVPGFPPVVENYLAYKQSRQDSIKDDDPLVSLKMVEKEITNPKLRELLAYNNAKYNLMYTKNLDAFFTLFNKLTQNTEHKIEIQKKYDNIKVMTRGNPAPDFTAYDIDGKEYHLKDFAGKPLYIDLWATWCSPCRAEIPFLEKIKAQYKDKNINFLSLDVYDDTAKWKAMVKAQNMGGWQLSSPDREMDFLKKFVVDGIPRFILLDKDGKIIDANAPRPSDKKLIELLDKSLSENGKN